MTFSLLRQSQTDAATFGQLVGPEHESVCCTLELPWRNNEHGRSCIPAGTYTAHRRFSPKHNVEVFEIDGVPDRDNIEMHIGNFAHDSLGCILLGSRFGMVDDERCVLGSRIAFESFMHSMQGVDSFTLVVRDPTPLAA